MVRNVANLVPPFELDGQRHGVSAALEFAVTQLEVSDIIMIGHGACWRRQRGARAPVREQAPGAGGFIAHWVDVLDEARDRVVGELGTGPGGARARARDGARLDRQPAYFCIPEREAEGTLRLHGAYFAIADGLLHVMDEQGNFAPA